MVLVAGGGLVAYLRAPARHSIRGYVRSGDGTAMKDVDVDLVAMDDSEQFRRTKTDELGWYAFTNLGAKAYTLTIHDRPGRPSVMRGIGPGATINVTASGPESAPAPTAR